MIDPNADSPKPRPCTIKRGHPYDNTKQPCGRPAAYLVGLKKPCDHVIDQPMCVGCWQQSERTPGYQMNCSSCSGPARTYDFKTAIVRWERI